MASDERNWTETDDGYIHVLGRYGLDGMYLEPSQCNEIHVKLGSGEGYFNQDDLAEAVQTARPDAGPLAPPVDGASPSPGATGSNLELRLSLDMALGYPHPDRLDRAMFIIATHVAEEKRKLREEIAAELAMIPAECYPEDVFGRGLSTDDTRNISEALAPLGITLDRISAAVMRHAYKNATRIARGE